MDMDNIRISFFKDIQSGIKADGELMEAFAVDGWNGFDLHALILTVGGTVIPAAVYD